MKNNQMFNCALLLLSSFMIANAVQADEEVSVKLHKIEKIKPQESGGDELYISVTEYPSGARASHTQVPSFPTHWLSQFLTNVNDVTLWKKTMKVCEPSEVIFSLVEEDLPPWNPDDLLGSVKLKLNCENGKIATEWLVPNLDNTKKDENKPSEFIFNGDGTEYRLLFSFESNKVKAEKP